MIKKSYYIGLILLGMQAAFSQSDKAVTICNPLNLNYRFCLDKPSRREAADPVIVTYKDEYYLFASKSGGYWHSTNLADWDFITSPDLPFEDYAPAAVVMDDAIYFVASTQDSPSSKIFKSDNPKSGRWQVVNKGFPIPLTDPDLFLDDDGRLYMYYGCSNVNPIYVVEMDRKTLNPIGEPTACMNENIAVNGWERPGDTNKSKDKPWTEGAWMTKFKGKYYLQYSTPGTEYRSYCDGMYVADSPKGPFTLLENNPFSYRPGGFATGAGHSGTFQDKYGNYWHITTTTISVKHNFERRLSLFPAFFKDEETIYTYTGFGDFPMTIPQKKTNGEADYAPGQMLLSYKKPVTASSALNGHETALASDEDIRTYWSAKSGDKGEWLSIDLQKSQAVNTLQVNFAENDTKLFGREKDIYYQYTVEYSVDGKNWKMLADKSANTADAPHDYIILDKPVKARYLKLTNLRTPSGTFAVSDFRIFGKGDGKSPAKASGLTITRNKADECSVQLKWKADAKTVGYNIRYGRKPDQLYLNYQVYGTNELEINSLSNKEDYYFTVDSSNENGITRGTDTQHVK
ncbi:family 43 glycosylhydrolase [Flavobacterium sp. DG1-102-2]|uniref:family 43 glycosylhydrolase n=1 Tax=Flavobacterium sp. DG1-102-2 TaxID=3081663 RepID=UPI00294A2C19|nr:family 43 glycosylhydrolase [Flavobacterium sp. DG1-102-2]MDV6170024.1 family 43 glycosylhydrolase [Flavobacterium sp. DG1-102-2]